MRQAYALRIIAAVSVLGFLAACSSARYDIPVKKFATATQAAEEALGKLNDDIGRAYWEVQRARIGRGELLVIREKGDCALGSARCRLVMEDAAGVQTPFGDQAPLSNALDVMAGINTYAEGLAAIIAADTAQAVQGHVNATLGSIQKLAGTLAEAKGGKAAASAVPDFAAPVGQIVNWVAGQYVEAVKVSALRRATRDADPILTEAAGFFRTTAFFSVAGARKQLTENVRTALDALGPSPDAAAIERLSASARSYDLFLQSDPARTFAAMGEAHAALARNLSSRDVSFASVVAEIDRFSAEAATLAKAAKQVNALFNAKE